MGKRFKASWQSVGKIALLRMMVKTRMSVKKGSLQEMLGSALRVVGQ